MRTSDPWKLVVVLTALTGLGLAATSCRSMHDPASETLNNGVEVANPEQSTTVPIDLGGGWCSGIIISPYPHVLTNAHCIRPGLKVRVKGVWVAPDAVDVPEKYAAKHLNEEGDVLYDVAILTLPRGTPIPGYVNISKKPPAIGDRLTMRGFGVTHYGGGGAGILREGKNTAMSCVSALAQCPGCRRDWIPKEFRVQGAGEHPGMICLYGPVVEHAPEGMVSTGFGDSGSGVLNEAGELVAVAGGGTWDPVRRDYKVTIFGVLLWKGHLDFIRKILAKTNTPLPAPAGQQLVAVGRADGSDGPPGVKLPSQCLCRAEGEVCKLKLGARVIASAPMAGQAEAADPGAVCSETCKTMLTGAGVRRKCY